MATERRKVRGKITGCNVSHVNAQSAFVEMGVRSERGAWTDLEIEIPEWILRRLAKAAWGTVAEHRRQATTTERILKGEEQ